ANKDLCPIVPQDINHKKVIFYGKEFGAIYKIENIQKNKGGFDFSISYEGKIMMDAFYEAVSEVELYSIGVAMIIANKFQIPEEKIKKAVNQISSFSGRMQKLKGIKNSIILDDTYNASPVAVKMALNALYNQETPQRIAILGMMNELGDSSEIEHQKIGQYCDPKFLDLVVTIGFDANKFLASEARKKGCQVYEAQNSVDAGNYVKNKIKEGAVILAKGSQNGVFAEEALKPFLADQSDISKLVRQDKYWLDKKKF
ncbi:MAG: cyanophycin synthetase, partial [Candidatus Paceibacterota bacterium]